MATVLDELVAILGFDLKGVGQAKKYQKTMGGVERGMNALGIRGIAVGNILASAVVGGFRAASRGAQNAIGGAVSFEEAMADINKVVDATPDQLDTLSDTFLKMSRELPVSAEGLASIAAEAGAAGVALEDLEGFTRQVAIAVTAFDLPAAQVGETMAKLSNVFGFNIEQMGMFNDTVNHLSNNMAAKAGEILNFTNRAAAAATAFGLSADQLAGVGAALIASGVVPETAARGLNNLANRIQTDAKGVDGALQSVGLSTAQLQKDLATDGDAALLDLFTRLSKLDVTKQAVALKGLAGLDFADDFSKFLANPETLAQGLALANDEVGKLGSVTEEFEARAATTAAKWQRVKGIISSVATVAAGPLLDAFGKVAGVVFEITEILDGAGSSTEKLQAIAGALGFDISAEQAQGLLDVLTTTFNFIKTTATAVVGALVAHFTNLFGVISEGFDLAGFTMAIQQSGVLSSAVAGIVAAFRGLSTIVGAVVGGIVAHFSNLSEGTALRSMIERVAALGDKLSEVFGGGGPASEGLALIGKIAGALISAFATSVMAAFLTVVELVVSVISTLAEVIGKLANGDILGALGSLFGGIGDIVQILVGHIGTMLKVINDLFTSITGLSLGDLFDNLVEAGKNAAIGLKDGFISVMQTLGALLRDLILDAVAGALNIAVSKINGLIAVYNASLGKIAGKVDAIEAFDFTDDDTTATTTSEQQNAANVVAANTIQSDADAAAAANGTVAPVVRPKRVATVHPLSNPSTTSDPVPVAPVATNGLSGTLPQQQQPTTAEIVEISDYLGGIANGIDMLQKASNTTAQLQTEAPQLLEQTTNNDNTKVVNMTNTNVTTINQDVTGPASAQEAARATEGAAQRGTDRGLTVANQGAAD